MYAPAEDPNDRLIAINDDAEMYNTGILPSEIKKEFIQMAASDESTSLVVGGGKFTSRIPYGFTVTEVRAADLSASNRRTTLKCF